MARETSNCHFLLLDVSHMEASVDRFGRVVIPKRIREQLGLHPGSPVRIEACQGEVRVIPQQDHSGLVVKEGVTVYGGTATGDLDDTLRSLRDLRLDQLQGPKRK